MAEDLNIDEEEIEEAWLVCFGDDEGWHPSMAAGLFFSHKDAEAFIANDPDKCTEWCVLRVLPFDLKVVNDVFDPENPPKGAAR